MMWLTLALAAAPVTPDELRALLEESAQRQACEVREVVALEQLTGCRAAVVELHAEAVRVLDEEQERDDDQLRQLVELQAVTERQARQLSRVRQQRAVLAAVVVGLGAGVVGALAL